MFVNIYILNDNFEKYNYIRQLIRQLIEKRMFKPDIYNRVSKSRLTDLIDRLHFDE